MEGNMLYHLYLKKGADYFTKVHSSRTAKEFSVEQMPKDCVVISDEGSSWKYYDYKDNELPDQGWKIHISTYIKEARAVLKTVSNIMFKHKVAFKHLKTEEFLINTNSKNADRARSGKFIAIYPKDDEEFLFLLEALETELRSFEKGPYILNDKRWKETNIYYRYGGFKSILNEKKQMCIKDQDGHLIVDKRTPFYQVPDFVQDFDQYLDSINKVRDQVPETNAKMDLYSFKEALGFSNGGGIYLAERKSDRKKVIIKEARPKAGLDARFRDAVDRQEIEYDALTRLADVKGVVNVIDRFQAWEHHFMVEEYVEGINLHSWIGKHYPFMNSADINHHKEKITFILKQLVDIMKNIHLKGLSMGDLQPANIIISDDLNVTLIDFETAAPSDLNEQPGMQTMAFSSAQIKNNGARDWYAVKKIIRFCLLPVHSSEELDKYLTGYHYKWIKEVYGDTFFQWIEHLNQECNDYLVEYGEEATPLVISKKTKNDDIHSIIAGLKRGISKNLTQDGRLINGDIRQYEYENGKRNVLNGGAGALWAFKQTGDINEQMINWIEEYLAKPISRIEDNGLLTGKAGMAVVLYECGYEKESTSVFSEIINNLDESDVSLRSGLAGIGLALTSLHAATNDELYLQKAKSIAQGIDRILTDENELTVRDWSGVLIGLIDGWSGVSLFYTALYGITKEETYYSTAKALIEKDLTKTDVDKGILYTMDKSGRLLPYLSGGSIGVAVAIWYLNRVKQEKHYEQEFNAITRLAETRSTISGGLFEGAASFLLIPPLVGEQDECYEKKKEAVLDLLRLFLIEKEDYLVFPGQFSYRLADDLFSGSAGVILALTGILKNNPLYWLPVIHNDQFFNKQTASSDSKRLVM
ncbi:class III lanthionine synthetase LanKC [Shouchella clausii]|uniref:class III lanthionine synthetase LanKC n=1 Tax=Shouchella clausii TaxID=79880 RepID=UPI000D1F84C8|nr:class III lanthionine synthetase LanKC [Shouchella clausii]PTL24490.1 hypothetical protein DA802_02865 [Shouchella clausii]